MVESLKSESYNNLGDTMYVRMLSDFLKEQYGEKYYRLSLNGGMTCPNRDGTCGDSGCLFCTEQGSGEFTPDALLTIDRQISEAKRLIASKSVSDKYIAYFQAFSNTYAPVDYLDRLFSSVIYREDIAILSIATRPDCLSDDVIRLINKLNKIKPVWVELGLQTSKESTARLIRRGYDNACYESAVSKLKSIGCSVITHIILGLPYECKADMIDTARYAGSFSDGIKFHMLYVAENTDLATLYKKGDFNLLTRDEYIDILCECIRVIPKTTVIHRLTGDGDKSQLLAPMWTADKKKVLREIQNAFIDRDVTQGEKL